MINKIASSDSTKSLTDSGSWGNHLDKATTGYIGRYATYNTSNTTLSKFSSDIQTNGTKAANSYQILTTGASDKTRSYNIYDVAGNLWEWTEETSFYGGNSATQYREYRGGSFAYASAAFPACFRSGDNSASTTNCSIGFRVVLYMK